MASAGTVAAVIDAGVVVNVCALDDEVDYSEWLSIESERHDEVRIVPDGTVGIGWTIDDNGVLRPAQPYPSWTWDGSEWNAPVPYPDDGGDYWWDESQGSWQTSEP